MAESATPGAEVPKRPGLEEVRGWTGYRLDEIGGAGVGRVEGAFVDAVTEQPEWLVARMGRFGHHTLVPARDAVEGIGRVWIPYSRDVIRRAPKVDPVASLAGGTERALLEHYGIAGAMGRAAELDERDPDEVSVRPA
jgi:hypothetical protein